MKRVLFVHRMLARLSTRVVCISDAVKQLLLLEQPHLEGKTLVVWNGIERT